MTNLLHLIKPPPKEQLIEELVQASKEVVLAQRISEQALERLQRAIENYTGEHWIRWT